MRSQLWITCGFLILVMPANSYAQPTEDQSEIATSRPPGFAIVELFTSEGCSSCPPADRLLSQVQAKAKEQALPVYVLGFHVDYWNRLGWTDRFSSQEISERQRMYARHWKSRRVYTPQAIVNGSVEFNGSNPEKMSKAISQALNRPTKVTLQLKARRGDGKIVVEYEIPSAQNARILHVAIVQEASSTKVLRGENARRELTHTNAVLSLSQRPLGNKDPNANKGQVVMDIPKSDASARLSVIGFLTSADSPVMLGGSATAIEG